MPKTYSYVVIANNVELKDKLAKGLASINAKQGTVTHISQSSALSAQEGIIFNTVIILYTTENDVSPA